MMFEWIYILNDIRCNCNLLEQINQRRPVNFLES